MTSPRFPSHEHMAWFCRLKYTFGHAVQEGDESQGKLPLATHSPLITYLSTSTARPLSRKEISADRASEAFAVPQCKCRRRFPLIFRWPALQSLLSSLPTFLHYTDPSHNQGVMGKVGKSPVRKTKNNVCQMTLQGTDLSLILHLLQVRR